MMTGGQGVIIRRPSVAESLRVLLGGADCGGAMGVVEMALSPGASGPPLPVAWAFIQRHRTCRHRTC